MKRSLFLFILFHPFLSFSQDHIADSLLSLLGKPKPDSVQIVLLNDISSHYGQTGNYDESKKYALRSLELSAAAASKGDSSLTLIKAKAVACNILGNVFDYQGNYPLSLKYHFEALKLHEQILARLKKGDVREKNVKSRVAASYNNIGIVYLEQGDYDAALQNYEKALKLLQEVKDTSQLAGSYINIGNIYGNQGIQDKALENYLIALEFSKRSNNLYYLSNSHACIGLILQMKGNYTKALDHLFASLNISVEIGDEYGAGDAYINLGAVHTKIKKTKEARELYLKGLALSVKNGNKQQMSQEYLGLSLLDSLDGNYGKALLNYKKYVAYRDSVNNDESTKNSVRISMQYDFDKKQAADSVKVAEEKKVEAAELKTEQDKQYSLYGGLVLLLALSAFVLNRFRITRKQKLVIESQKEEVEMQKKIIEEKNKDVLDSIYYARRIQRALLPSERYVNTNLKRLNK